MIVFSRAYQRIGPIGMLEGPGKPLIYVASLLNLPIPGGQHVLECREIGPKLLTLAQLTACCPPFVVFNVPIL